MMTQTALTESDPRRAWAPAGAIRVAAKDSSAVAYIGTHTTVTEEEYPCAVLWSGRRRKPAKASGVFFSVEERNRAVAEHFEWVRRVEERRRENTAARKAARANHQFRVGSIVVSSWGYDQTNVDAYQVVKMCGKTMVLLRPIGLASVGEDSDAVRPVPDAFISEETLRRRVGETSVSINSSQHASLWDGERSYYRTPYGMGH